MADEEDKPQFIQPPSTLKAKVGPPVAGGIDMAALERAEQVIANLAGNYLEWVQEDLKKLQKAFDTLAATPAGQRKQALKALFQIAHDIKGQGGSFGYHLMTTIGHYLCRYIEKLEDAGAKEVDVIRLHVDAMKIVIAKRLEGEGGREGMQLVKGIELVHGKIGSPGEATGGANGQ
jgi:hypothetical protein